MFLVTMVAVLWSTVTAHLSGFSLKWVISPFQNLTFAHLSGCALKWVFVDFSEAGAECSVKWVFRLTYQNHGPTSTNNVTK